jgi:ubiquinone/menaquinone biosynthesis C-methylase UbiE
MVGRLLHEGDDRGQARRLGRQGRQARVVVVERDAAALALARRVSVAYPEIALVRADASALPFRRGAFDVVTSGLLLHHLEPDAAVATLRDMAAVARGGVLVNDLLRTRLAWGLVWLATRLCACHRFSRHDGPLSVRRAYSPDELRRLAEAYFPLVPYYNLRPRDPNVPGASEWLAAQRRR